MTKTRAEYIKDKQIEYKLNLASYWALAIIRVLLTFLPQIGYIHPDEYFQSLEVVAGDILETDTTRTWEFNVSFPIRSITFPYLTVGVPISFLNLISIYVKYYFNIELKTSYMLLVFPRIFICLLSFITDYSLYKICLIYGQNYRSRLCTLASSFVMIVYATHTFSNTIEMMLTSLLIYLVSDCMFYSDHIMFQKEFLINKYQKASKTVDKVKFYKLKASLPVHSLRRCIEISVITVAGIFNRPTFIVFALFPVFFWLQRGLGSKTVTLADFHIRIFSLMLSGIPTALFFIVIDSFYYGYITLAEIQHLDVSINSFVVTPLNFIKYNLDNKNLAEHGIHPMFLHFLVNIPLLYNVLGVIGLVTSLNMAYKFCRGSYTALPRVQSIMGLMTGCFVGPVALLSLIRHQEPRFLIPITLPLVFLFSQYIRKNNDTRKSTFNPLKNKKVLLTIWYIFNIVFTLFFGFLHQGGVYPLAEHFSSVMISKPKQTIVHLVTSHIYNMPQSFLYIPSTKKLRINHDTGQKYKLSKQFFLYEMGSSPMDTLFKQTNAILEVSQLKYRNQNLHYQMYVAIPASLSNDFIDEIFQSNNTHFQFREYKRFYPHISTEALPSFYSENSCLSQDEMVNVCSSNKEFLLPLRNLLNFWQQFGLILYKIEYKIQSFPAK